MKIGILGATGAVGRQMLDCLYEQQIDFDEIRLFASPKSAGKRVHHGQDEYQIQTVTKESLQGLDVVLGAVSNTLAKEYHPLIQDSGAVFIDNSSAFRLDKEVPLVVPEINGEDAKKHHGIIANPNCSTIIALMAVAPIHKISPTRKMIVSTYQAVSGAGIAGLSELTSQVEAIHNQMEIQTKVFPKQIAYNCIPMIGSFLENGYTSEEMKMQNEGRKILHDDGLQVSCTCVRVPVYRSHSISISLQCEKALDLEIVKQALGCGKGIILKEDFDYPTPLETSNQDLVYVGRVRKDLVFDGGISLWCCGDQIRKGAASNAVQIIKCL